MDLEIFICVISYNIILYIFFSDILIKTVGRYTAISTHSNDARKCSGPPSELDKTVSLIFRQLFNSYFLINTSPHLIGFVISQLIAKDLIG